MSKIHIVGLAGSDREAAAAILRECGGFVQVAFADALRAEIAEAFSIEAAWLTQRAIRTVATPVLALRNCRALGFIGAAAVSEGRPELETSRNAMAEFLDQPRSPRELLHLWGTEYRRRQNPAYWTRILVDKVSTMRKAGVSRFVITDVKHANEVGSVKLMGGRIWQLGAAGDRLEFEAERFIVTSGDERALRRAVLRAYWEQDTGLSVLELGAAGA